MEGQVVVIDYAISDGVASVSADPLVISYCYSDGTCEETAFVVFELEEEATKDTDEDSEEVVEEEDVVISDEFEEFTEDWDEVLGSGEELSAQSVEKLNEYPFPIPYMAQMDEQGAVEIKLTKECLVVEDRDMLEFAETLMEEEYFIVSLQDKSGNYEIKGEPKFDEDLFVE